MSSWEFRSVPVKFQISDRTLFSVFVPLQVKSYRLLDGLGPVAQPELPSNSLNQGSQGYMIRSLPVVDRLPAISIVQSYIRYVPLQYHHFYIDLNQTFEEYKAKFTSKTRSTINRKIRKYGSDNKNGIDCRCYRTPSEMQDFLTLAREVSKKTYQEKLLDAGLPNDDNFLHEIATLAEEDNVRAYILFKENRPISYLCCPAEDGVLVYAYQGYDPEFMHMSVGTVLQWLALEHLFSERRFKIFDFTEGESQHKRLFATHHKHCANVMFLKNSFRNRMLVRIHFTTDRSLETIGELLHRWGAKARIKRMLRFGPG